MLSLTLRVPLSRSDDVGIQHSRNRKSLIVIGTRLGYYPIFKEIALGLLNKLLKLGLRVGMVVSKIRVGKLRLDYRKHELSNLVKALLTRIKIDCGNDCLKYVAMRNILNRRGKTIELLAVNDPAVTMTCEWWKQLFGESEGKDGKGIYPASVVYSTDLHSMGQFVQDGTRLMFETVLNIDIEDGVTIPYDAENADGLNFLAGKSLNFVNQKAHLGTVLAHTDGDVPNLAINITSKSAFDFGYLVYFFEKAVAVSGYTIGVNPFNQPGVESYKKNMFALLDKPGYAEHKAALDARLADLA